MRSEAAGTQGNVTNNSTCQSAQAGAAVNLLVEHKKGGHVSLSFRDQKCTIIHGDCKISWDGALADGYFHAMRRNDQFQGSTVHRYNLLQTVYICRNRLTHWSNPGSIAGMVPPSEQLNKALSAVELCRNIVSSIKLSCMCLMILTLKTLQPDLQGCPQAATNMFYNTPVPKLFPEL